MVKRICPICKREYEINTGLHNWKNLLRKPTIDDLITFFIILMVILSYFAYEHDIKEVENNCKKKCRNEIFIYDTNLSYSLNLSQSFVLPINKDER